MSWIRHAYLRYRGSGVRAEGSSCRRARYNRPTSTRHWKRFHRAYRDAYGYEQTDQPVEATDWHLTAVAASTRAPPGFASIRSRGGKTMAKRPAYFPELDGMIECENHDRANLDRGNVIEGPALITDPDSTTLVLPADTVTVDVSGNLLIEVSAETSP